ncbi:MAG TPA: metal ABC transporter permease [Gammaproteobacteria bacterium]|nr:metal ABC transporter permease [Gammaproteobacteria bacterium]
MDLSNIEFSIIGPAFLAGLLVLSTHVPLGREVLRRGIIFIDLAIAQIAGLGVIAAYNMGWDVDGWQVQVVAAGSAVAGAILLRWLELRWQESLEALIGVIFILAASSGILLLANNPHGGEHLRKLLTGQILWVDLHHLLPVAILYAVLLVLWFSLREKGGSLLFYIVFALSVTASVQLVGVYLVFSSLIVPALATRNIPVISHALLLAYLIGASGYALGLLVSSISDLPSGAIIVWSLVIAAWLYKLIVYGLVKRREQDAEA